LRDGTGLYGFWTLGRNRKRERAKATLIAIPQEATMPKAWKNKTRRIGSGILSREKMVFLESVNSALLLARKTESIKLDNVHARVKAIKAKVKTAFFVMKLRVGDQKFKPTRKIPATTRLMSPLKVKLEFINSWGLSVCGRKRMSEEFKPTKLSRARRLIAEIIAELKPTSASL